MSEKNDAVRKLVSEKYGEIAELNSVDNECGCSSSCCGEAGSSHSMSDRLGYSPEDLSSIPQSADMGLGCGNPGAIAALKPGETVLDLGCGGGLDCFLAAKQVGADGQVIGVDMTSQMVGKARENVRSGSYENIDIRLGEIEHLPVADNCVDVIISNCVINLSPDKPAVYREALRVLKPGGRLAISDVVATAQIPQEIRDNPAFLCGCIGGAAIVGDLEKMLAEIGFVQIEIKPKDESRKFIKDWAPGRGIEDYVVSADIQAVKP